ncbi:TIGR02543 family repeat-containing cell surface protein [methanogenic archaeon mixed culture ISO4-G1]|nr:TIGR02543 family repeat-containing cell surface protein [methanogenic archaeon mixed culture ISO4-G1]
MVRDVAISGAHGGLRMKTIAVISVMACMFACVAVLMELSATAPNIENDQYVIYHPNGATLSDGSEASYIEFGYYGIASTEYNPERWYDEVNGKDISYVYKKDQQGQVVETSTDIVNWVGPDGVEINVWGYSITITAHTMNAGTYRIDFPEELNYYPGTITGATRDYATGGLVFTTAEANKTTTITMTDASFSYTPNKVFGGWGNDPTNPSVVYLPGDVIPDTVTDLWAVWVQPDVFEMKSEEIHYSYWTNNKYTLPVSAPYALLDSDDNGKLDMDLTNYKVNRDGEQGNTGLLWRDLATSDHGWTPDMYKTIYKMDPNRFTNKHSTKNNIGEIKVSHKGELTGLNEYYTNDGVNFTYGYTPLVHVTEFTKTGDMNISVDRLGNKYIKNNSDDYMCISKIMYATSDNTKKIVYLTGTYLSIDEQKIGNANRIAIDTWSGFDYSSYYFKDSSGNRYTAISDGTEYRPTAGGADYDPLAVKDFSTVKVNYFYDKLGNKYNKMGNLYTLMAYVAYTDPQDVNTMTLIYKPGACLSDEEYNMSNKVPLTNLVDLTTYSFKDSGGEVYTTDDGLRFTPSNATIHTIADYRSEIHEGKTYYYDDMGTKYILSGNDYVPITKVAYDTSGKKYVLYDSNSQPYMTYDEKSGATLKKINSLTDASVYDNYFFKNVDINLVVPAGTFTKYEGTTNNSVTPTIFLLSKDGNVEYKPFKMGGDVIFDSLGITTYTLSARHGDGGVGGSFVADGHKLIMGSNITNPKLASNKDPRTTGGAPQLIGGSAEVNITTAVVSGKEIVYEGDLSSTVDLGTYLIIHSGIYQCVVAGSVSTGSILNIGTNGQNGNLSTYTVMKGGLVTDTFCGGNAGTSRGGSVYGASTNDLSSGGVFVYILGGMITGDNYEDKASGYKLDNPAGGDYLQKLRSSFMTTESSVLEGGNSKGTNGNTSNIFGTVHLFISDRGNVWDAQAAGRTNYTTTQNAFMEISGIAKVRHVACGTITDAAEKDANTVGALIADNSGDNRGTIDLHVMGNAMVANLIGGGYDTFAEAQGRSLMKGHIQVTVEGGTVGNVYGGGYRGSIGDREDSSQLTITVTVKGGTVENNVYGGGSGGQNKIHHNENGSINANAEQGKNSTGRSYVYGTVEVNVTGGVVKGSVYGGGMSVPKLYQYCSYGDNSFKNESVEWSNNYVDKDPFNYVASVKGPVTVNVTGGEIWHDVYGAGRGIEIAYTPGTGTHSSDGNYTFANGTDEYITNTIVKRDGTFYQMPWLTNADGSITYKFDTSASFISADAETNRITSGYYLDFARVVGPTKVNVTGGSIGGDVYGGGAVGKVVSGKLGPNNATPAQTETLVGSTTVDVSNGTIEGNVFGGGLGRAGVSVTGATSKSTTVVTLGDNFVYISGADTSIGGSVYGGSSVGDDGSQAKFETGTDDNKSDTRIVIEEGTIGGSVYGGGFMGNVWGNTSIYVGYDYEYNSLTDRYTFAYHDSEELKYINLGSIYAGADIGLDDTASSAEAFRPGVTPVHGDGSIYIHGNNNRPGMTISGSIMGSGNSCMTGGFRSIFIEDFTNDSETTIKGIHRADVLTIENSVLDIDVRNTQTTAEGEPSRNASIYLIGKQADDSTGMTLKDGTTITIYGPVGEVSKFESRNSRDAYTSVTAPSNKVIFSGGATFNVRTGTTYNQVYGYTEMAVKDRSDYGAYVLGSSSSTGGFVVYKDSIYKVAETSYFSTGKCWYIAGIEKKVINMTLSADEDQVEHIVTSSVDIMKIQDNAKMKYTGGTFTKLSSFDAETDYTFVQPGVYYEDQVLHREYMGFMFGFQGAEDYHMLSTGTGQGEYTTYQYNATDYKGIYYREGVARGLPLNCTGYTNADQAGSYTLNFLFSGMPRNQTAYIGYLTLNFQETKDIVYEVPDGNGGMVEMTQSMLVNTVEVRIDLYVAGSGGLNSDDDFYVNVNLVKRDDVCSGSTDVLVPEGYIRGVTTLKWVEFSGISDQTVLNVHMANNSDNTSGWMGVTPAVIRNYSTGTTMESILTQVDNINDNLSDYYFRDSAGNRYVTTDGLVYTLIGGEEEYDIRHHPHTTVEIDGTTYYVDIFGNKYAGAEDPTPVSREVYKKVGDDPDKDKKQILYLNGTKISAAERVMTDAMAVNEEVGTLSGSMVATIVYQISNNIFEQGSTITLHLDILDSAGVHHLSTIVLTPKMIRTYEITFYDDYANPENYRPVVITVPYMTKLTAEDCPQTLDNFSGWYIDEMFTNTFSFDNPITGDMTLYARYTFAVVFDEQDGKKSTLYVAQQHPGALMKEPEAPVREGYVFEGWYKEKNLLHMWDFDMDPVEDNITLYAKWTGIEFKVIFVYVDKNENEQVFDGWDYDNSTDHRHGKIGEEYDIHGADANEYYVMKWVAGNAIYPTVKYGASFSTQDPTQGGKNILTFAEEKLSEQLGTNPFIRWFVVVSDPNAQQGSFVKTQTVYSDTILSRDIVDWENNTVTLYATTGSISIELYMKLKDDTHDATAKITPPYSYLVYPIPTNIGWSSEHSKYLDEYDNIYYAVKNSVVYDTEVQDPDYYLDNDKLVRYYYDSDSGTYYCRDDDTKEFDYEIVDGVTYYYDKWGNKYTKSGTVQNPVYTLVSRVVYEVSGDDVNIKNVIYIDNNAYISDSERVMESKLVKVENLSTLTWASYYFVYVDPADPTDTYRCITSDGLTFTKIGGGASYVPASDTNYREEVYSGVRYYFDAVGNKYVKDANENYVLVSRVAYLASGDYQNQKQVLYVSNDTYITDDERVMESKLVHVDSLDDLSSYYFMDVYKNRYQYDSNRGEILIMSGYSENYYHFEYTLNEASRSGYRLSGWHNTNVPENDAEYPTSGVQRLMKIFITNIGGHTAVTKEVLHLDAKPVITMDFKGKPQDTQKYVYPNNETSFPCIDVPTKAYRIVYEAEWERLTYTISITDQAHGIVDAYLLDQDNGTRTYIENGTVKAHYGDRIELRYTPPGTDYVFSKWLVYGDYELDDATSSRATMVVHGDAEIMAKDIGEVQVRIIVYYDYGKDGSGHTNGKLEWGDADHTDVYLVNSRGVAYHLDMVKGVKGEFFYTGEQEQGEVYRGMVPVGTDYKVHIRYGTDPTPMIMKEPDSDGDGVDDYIVINSSQARTLHYYAILARIMDFSSGIYNEVVNERGTTRDHDGNVISGPTKVFDAITGEMIVSITKYVGVRDSLLSLDDGWITNNSSNQFPAVQIVISEGYYYDVLEGFPDKSYITTLIEVGKDYTTKNGTVFSLKDGSTYYPYQDTANFVPEVDTSTGTTYYMDKLGNKYIKSNDIYTVSSRILYDSNDVKYVWYQPGSYVAGFESIGVDPHNVVEKGDLNTGLLGYHFHEIVPYDVRDINIHTETADDTVNPLIHPGGPVNVGSFNLNWTRTDAPADIVFSQLIPKAYTVHYRIGLVNGESPQQDLSYDDEGQHWNRTFGFAAAEAAVAQMQVYEGYSVVGWYYDAACTQMVPTTQTLDFGTWARMQATGHTLYANLVNTSVKDVYVRTYQSIDGSSYVFKETDPYEVIRIALDNGTTYSGTYRMTIPAGYTPSPVLNPSKPVTSSTLTLQGVMLAITITYPNNWDDNTDKVYIDITYNRSVTGELVLDPNRGTGDTSGWPETAVYEQQIIMPTLTSGGVGVSNWNVYTTSDGGQSWVIDNDRSDSITKARDGTFTYTVIADDAGRMLKFQPSYEVMIQLTYLTTEGIFGTNDSQRLVVQYPLNHALTTTEIQNDVHITDLPAWVAPNSQGVYVPNIKVGNEIILDNEDYSSQSWRYTLTGDTTMALIWNIKKVEFRYSIDKDLQTDAPYADVSATVDSNEDYIPPSQIYKKFDYNSEIIIKINPIAGRTVDMVRSTVNGTSVSDLVSRGTVISYILDEDRGFQWEFKLTADQSDVVIVTKTITKTVNFFVNGTLQEQVDVDQYDSFEFKNFNPSGDWYGPQAVGGAYPWYTDINFTNEYQNDNYNYTFIATNDLSLYTYADKYIVYYHNTDGSVAYKRMIDVVAGTVTMDHYVSEYFKVHSPQGLIFMGWATKIGTRLTYAYTPDQVVNVAVNNGVWHLYPYYLKDGTIADPIPFDDESHGSIIRNTLENQDDPGSLVVYYADVELNAQNYSTAGTTTPIAKSQPGHYTVYYYILIGNASGLNNAIYETPGSYTMYIDASKEIYVIAPSKYKAYDESLPVGDRGISVTDQDIRVYMPSGASEPLGLSYHLDTSGGYVTSISEKGRIGQTHVKVILSQALQDEGYVIHYIDGTLYLYDQDGTVRHESRGYAEVQA